MTPPLPDHLRRALDSRFSQQCHGPLLEGVGDLLHKPDLHKARLVVQLVADAMGEDPLSQLAWWFPEDHPDHRPLHALNACRIAVHVANAAGLDASTLGLAGLMYDAGMYDSGVELAVMHDHPLDSQARLALRQHTAATEHRLDALGFPAEVRQAAREHHERADGTGYPDGLTREHLSDASLLLQLIDSFLGQVEPRRFRPRRPPNEAMARLKDQAEQGRYDLAAFRTFSGAMGSFPVGCVVVLSNGELAVVSSSADGDPAKPEVLVLSDAEGSALDLPIPVKLSERRGLKIMQAC
jgi:HD-GYP domain-containing protein (c-di-GMP phosphodiesterase class II)